MVLIFGNERLVSSGESLKNTSWKGEKLLNASDANVFIAKAVVVANNGHICPLFHRCLTIISFIVLVCLCIYYCHEKKG